VRLSVVDISGGMHAAPSRQSCNTTFLPGSIVTQRFSRTYVMTPFNLAMANEPFVKG
jgi:hypothetical protein